MIILNKFSTKVPVHTLSGVSHIGQLSDNQIPDYITRDSELVTTSGVLYRQIGNTAIDGGFFI